jgi:ribokinase
MPDVILLGDINVDMIASFPAYPVWGGEGVAGTLEYHTGGGVVSTARALANMGVSVGLIGRIGSDALAQQVRSDLEKVGIDLTQLQLDPVVSTGLIYIVVTPDGERTMFSVRGANVFTQIRSDVEQYFIGSRWYHFSGYSLLAEPQSSAAIHGLESARQQRCRVSLDPGPELALRYQKRTIELLPKIDVFFPNESELFGLSGRRDIKDGVQILLEQGCKSIVVKAGRQGCIIADEKQYLEIPGFEVQVNDTTGAGDSFNAGVALGRMVGLSWPASGVLGNALGAMACARKGSGAGTINAKQVEELIAQDQFKPQWANLQSALEAARAWLQLID